MKNFKVVVSKWTKKITLIKKAENEIILKWELHKEGYSILSIEEIWDIEIKWNKFYFEIIQNWSIKKWTISSNDIFKAYLKIKEELWYEVKYIYYKEDCSEQEKKEIIYDIEEQYKIYKKIHKKEITEINKEKINKQKTTKDDENTDYFYTKKQLEKSYELLDKVIKKIDYLLNFEDNSYIDFKKKETLKNINNELIKLKSSTNIVKIKQIWELALIKTWELELKILESKKDENTRALLKETNKLLKNLWSKRNFIEKDKDIVLILKNFLNSIINFILEKKQEILEKKSRPKIDTKSSSYLKTKALYNKYVQKEKQLNKEILKNIYIYFIPNKKNKEKIEYYSLRKAVLSQNIKLLKNKLTWKKFSYILIVKWYNYFILKFLEVLYFFKNLLIIITIIYSFFFMLFNLMSFLWYINYNINYTWLFYFIFINLAFLLLNYTKWIITLIINVALLSFIYIFWIINF